MFRLAFASLVFAITSLASIGVSDEAIAQPKPADPPAKVEPGDAVDNTKAFVVFDPGCHTRPISSMGFTRDKSRLVTVGQDHTIQIWNVYTGDRIDIIRLAGSGREGGTNPNRWNYSAVSPDGTKVAIGGDSMGFGDGTRARLVVIDVPTRKVRHIVVPPRFAAGPLTAIAFSHDGDSLAAGFDGSAETGFKRNVIVWEKLLQFHELADADSLQSSPFQPVWFETNEDAELNYLSFRPEPKGSTERRLAVASRNSKINLWDVPRGAKAKAIKAATTVDGPALTSAVKWSPSGKQLVRMFIGLKTNHGVQEMDSVGKLTRKTLFEELTPTFDRVSTSAVYSMHFLSETKLMVIGETGGFNGGNTRFGTTVGIVDLAANPRKCAPIYSEESPGRFFPVGATTPDGQIGAATVGMGGEAVVFQLQDEVPKGKKTRGLRKAGEVLTRIGSHTPTPTQVAWSADAKKPGFAWSEEITPLRKGAKLSKLQSAYDLTELDMLFDKDPNSFIPSQYKAGNWSLEFGSADGSALSSFTVSNGKKLIGTFEARPRIPAATFIPTDSGTPLLAWTEHRYPLGSRFHLCTPDGKQTTQLLPNFPFVRDIAPSPDGRYFVAATGTHRIAIYRANLEYTSPLLYFATANGEWALWSSTGYYTASPGGEKLLGWVVYKGIDQPMDFLPAQTFAKTYRRPDVLKRAIELGNVGLAVKDLKLSAVPVDKILPPEARVKQTKQNGQKVEVEVRAASGVKNKPVVAMRLFLDGRPLPKDQGVWTNLAASDINKTLTIEVPPGKHELYLMARSEDGTNYSEPIQVKAPKDKDKQPTLYRVCVGVNNYDSQGLQLKAAVPDARLVYGALEKHCVGPDNRFGTAKGEILLDKEATQGAVLKALDNVKRDARPGDLVVVFFAGHGVKQGGDFFLLTREADTSKSLNGISISGSDLRKTLGGIECPVLMLFDACHSAAAVRGLFPPATNALSEGVTEETVGATLIAAAMSHETAGATAENGYFSAAFVKALEAGPGVPFDPDERALYIHDVYGVVFREVRKQTLGKQNPLLNPAPMAPPIVIREVP